MEFFDMVDPSAYALFSVFSIVSVWVLRNRRMKEMENEMVEYHGSCHCQGVKFTVKAPRHLVVWNCNCSICFMKKNWHFIVPASNFENTHGKELLTEYRFNTKTAKHMFCKVCGVQAYYVPRSNPDGVAVTLACVDQSEVSST